MEIRLHSPTWDDIDDIVDAGMRMQAEDAGQEHLTDPAHYRSRAIMSIDSPTCWVAKADGRFAGMLASYLTPHPYRPNKTMLLAEYIFYVLPEYRKTKVALKLIRAFEKYGRDCNVDEVTFCRMPNSDLDLDRLGYKPYSISYRKEINNGN